MDGGVEERFNAVLDEVWANVYDPNTEAKKTREITLKIKITPNDRRDSCDFRVSVVPKLASKVDLSQTVMLTVRDDGTVLATERTEQIPGQIDLEGNEQPIPQTVSFGKLHELK